MDYEHKIKFAIKLLQSIPQDDGPIELCYSGGKDSDVILELAKMSDIPFEAVYKQTTIDPPGTTLHAKEAGATIVRPKITFFQLIEKKGWPTRKLRFCCEALKEYKIYDRAIQGIRRSESVARAKRYKEPEVCRIYSNKEKVRVYLPILDWTNDDVERFVAERKIKCHPLYYDEIGRFHVEKRLGCIGCPLSEKHAIEDFKRYPKLFAAWVKAESKYLCSHPNVLMAKYYGNAYNIAFRNLFCDSYEDYSIKITGGLFPEFAVNTKEFLETYFNVEL